MALLRWSAGFPCWIAGNSFWLDGFSLRGKSLISLGKAAFPYGKNHFSLLEKSLFTIGKTIFPYWKNHFSLLEKPFEAFKADFDRLGALFRCLAAR